MKNFYEALSPIANPAELVRDHHFVAAPADWLIVMTDVTESTKAIQAGRYKQVNVVGASGIIAVTNAMEHRDFPSVFGGDGATFLVPPEKAEAVTRALHFIQDISRKRFDLDLRVLIMPVQAVHDAGKTVRIAKLELSKNNYQAMFAGGGIAHAEYLMKSGAGDYALRKSEAAGSIEGLECRWNPVPSRHGEILTLMIQMRPGVSEPSVQYEKILRQILAIAPHAAPVTLENLRAAWPPKDLWIEARWRAKGYFGRLFHELKAMAITGFAVLAIRAKQDDKASQVYRYLHQLTQNTDYLKFDDCLRMLLDVTLEQKRQITAVLERSFASGESFIGMHASKDALMTCFIQSLEKHFHFVDGGDGGYAIAALQMKQQMAAAS